MAAFAERDATVLGLHLPDAVKEAQNLDQRVAPAEADVTDTAVIAACRVPTTANDQRWARRWDLMGPPRRDLIDVISKIDNPMGDRLYFDKAGQRTGA